MNIPKALFNPPSGKPLLVIVCGHPATGKSTLAGLLREDLGWPLFTKDGFKELVADLLPSSNGLISRSQSQGIGKQSIALMFAVAHEILRSGNSCIVEANLLPHLAPADLAPLLKISEARQVHCTIPDDVLLARYRTRAHAGQRHWVHADTEAELALVERLENGGGSILPLKVPLLSVDTTQGYVPAIDKIVAFCRS